MTANFKNRTLWTGDNLDIMRGLNSESVDLIYLDPPFNSNQEYSAPIGSEAAGAAFKDTWTLDDVDLAWHGLIAEENPGLYRVIGAAREAHGKGMQSYLIMMAVRLLEMKRILKPTGSIYLHCDSTASHYLKLVMDAVFGRDNFLNEISWLRSQTRSSISRRYRKAHDTILFYCRTKRYQFSLTYKSLSDTSLKLYNNVDDRGHYQLVPVLVSGRRNGETGQIWRGIDPNQRGKSGMHWVTTPKNLEAYERDGRIAWPQKKGGVPRLKYYLEENPGVPVNDFWEDVAFMPSQSGENLGYPTQKPLALLERIIKASSNEGDVVLDPFCGCATALIAAEKLERQWVGIDLSPAAKRLVKSRMERELGLFGLQTVYRDDIPQRTDMGKLPAYQTHKHTLYGKQEGVCAGCKIMFPFRNLTIDHVVPQSKGGTDHIDNLQLLCNACNSMKGSKSQEEFLAALAQAGM